MPNTFHNDYQHGSISAGTTALGSASSSKAPSLQVQAPPSRTLSKSPSFLDVPSTSLRARRPSRDSTVSELSELSVYSDELDRHQSRSLLPSATRGEPNSQSHPQSQFHLALASFQKSRNYGVLLVLFAMFFGSLMNIGTRLLETPGPHGLPMHPFQILFVRQSITAACCSAYGFLTNRIPDFPLGPRSVRGLLVFRGLSGFFGVFGMYFSLLYLPLSEATVLTFLAPILTCYACSWLMPGEQFTRQQQLAGFVSLIGVVFIAQPASLFKSPSSPPPTSESSSSTPDPTPRQHLIAIAIAMLGVCGATGAMTAIRTIGTRAHAFISINYFSVWCSIVSLACLAIFPDVKFRLPGNVLEWSLLAFLGGAGFIMQFLLTAGLSYGGADGGQAERATNMVGEGDLEEGDRSAGGKRKVSSLQHGNVRARAKAKAKAMAGAKEANAKKGSQTRATSMVYTQMLFALAGDKLVFGVTPRAMSWIGSGLVLAGAIWVAAARDQLKETGNIHGEGDGGAVELDGLPVTEGTASKNENKSESGSREEGVGLMSGDGMGEEAVEMDDLALRKEGSH